MATTVVRCGDLAAYIHTLDDGYVCQLVGEADQHSSAAIEEALGLVPSIDGATVIVDCSDLVGIDAAGIAALLRAQERRSAGTLALASPSPEVLESFERLGLHEVFEIVP